MQEEGQPHLMRAVQTIQKVAATTSTKDKIKILKEGESETLKTLLYYTYNKYLTFRIKKIEIPEPRVETQPAILDDFVILCDLLASHTLGTTEASKRIGYTLRKCIPEVQEVLANVLLRDLRAGIDVKSVNKAFPQLVPTFEVMLASKLDDVDSITYPVVAECKLDGCRVVAVCDGETVKLFSREGREFQDQGVFANAILDMAPGFPAVYDGEIIAVKPNMENATCAKHIDGNWKFHYAVSLLKTDDAPSTEIRHHLRYYIWDVIDYDYFQSSGLKGREETLAERKTRLKALFDRRDRKVSAIQELPNTVCLNREQLLARFKELRQAGEEGMMIKFPKSKYEFKRSKMLLKMKEFYSFDLRVVGAEEGTGKYEGMLGALLCADDTGAIQTKVGSGFTDSERLEFYLEFLHGGLVGSVVEISAQEITEGGSLRFPTFLRCRPDKDTTNAEGVSLA